MKPFSFLRRHPVAFVALAGWLVAAAFVGCESADSYHISVSPGHASLKSGESVTLTAKGWNDYLWAMDKDGAGHLSATKGESVVFTAGTGVSNATVTVTVTAVGSGNASSGSSSTNSPSSGSGGYTATATIDIESI